MVEMGGLGAGENAGCRNLGDFLSATFNLHQSVKPVGDLRALPRSYLERVFQRVPYPLL